MVISAKMHRIAEEEIPFERLVVDINVAAEMFANNTHKSAQIPSIAKKSSTGEPYKLPNLIFIVVL